jgi:hypothetical protein
MVLISAENHRKAESQASVLSVTSKHIVVTIPSDMAGHVYGDILRFDKFSGEQINVHKWIKNRILLCFTQKRWEDIQKTRKEISLCHRIREAVYNNNIPLYRLEELAKHMEGYPKLKRPKVVAKS